MEIITATVLLFRPCWGIRLTWSCPTFSATSCPEVNRGDLDWWALRRANLIVELWVCEREACMKTIKKSEERWRGNREEKHYMLSVIAHRNHVSGCEGNYLQESISGSLVLKESQLSRLPHCRADEIHWIEVRRSRMISSRLSVCPSVCLFCPSLRAPLLFLYPSAAARRVIDWPSRRQKNTDVGDLWMVNYSPSKKAAAMAEGSVIITTPWWLHRHRPVHRPDGLIKFVSVSFRSFEKHLC